MHAAPPPDMHWDVPWPASRARLRDVAFQRAQQLALLGHARAQRAELALQALGGCCARRRAGAGSLSGVGTRRFARQRLLRQARGCLRQVPAVAGKRLSTACWTVSTLPMLMSMTAWSAWESAHKN